jgi:hypothetical protein
VTSSSSFVQHQNLACQLLGLGKTTMRIAGGDRYLHADGLADFTLSPLHLVTASPCHLVTPTPCHLQDVTLIFKRQQ